MANYPAWRRPKGSDPLDHGADDMRLLALGVDTDVKKVDARLPSLGELQTESGLDAAHEHVLERAARNWSASGSTGTGGRKVVGCFAGATLDGNSQGTLGLVSGFTAVCDAAVVTPYGKGRWPDGSESWFTVGVLSWTRTSVTVEARALTLHGVPVAGTKFTAGSIISCYMVAAGS